MIIWEQEQTLTSDQLYMVWYGYEGGFPCYVLSIWRWDGPRSHPYEVALSRIGEHPVVFSWHGSLQEAELHAVDLRARPEEAFMEEVL